MPEDLSAGDPAFDTRLDALEEGGGGGGSSAIGDYADYGNFTTPLEDDNHDFLAADYEEGDGDLQGDSIPAMDTDGSITFTDATAVFVYVYAAATFDVAPADGDVAVTVGVAGLSGSRKRVLGAGSPTAAGLGDGILTTIEAENTFLYAVPAGGVLGPLVVVATGADTIQDYEFLVTRLS